MADDDDAVEQKRKWLENRRQEHLTHTQQRQREQQREASGKPVDFSSAASSMESTDLGAGVFEEDDQRRHSMQRSQTSPSLGGQSKAVKFEKSQPQDDDGSWHKMQRRRVEDMMELEDGPLSGAPVSSKSFNNLAKKKATAQGFQELMTLTPQREKTRVVDRQQMLDDIKAQSDRFRAQIRRTDRATLNPHSKHMQRWDLLTTTALLFTATVTPFEVGIMEPTTLAQMATDPLAWINRIVDLIFFVDIAFQCFLAYQEQGEHGGAW